MWKLPIRLISFTNVVKVMVCWANQSFLIKRHAEKQKKKQKSKRKDSFAELKNI